MATAVAGLSALAIAVTGYAMDGAPSTGASETVSAAATSMECSGDAGTPGVTCRSENVTATIVDGMITIDSISAGSSISSVTSP